MLNIKTIISTINAYSCLSIIFTRFAIGAVMKLINILKHNKVVYLPASIHASPKINEKISVDIIPIKKKTNTEILTSFVIRFR